MHPSTVESRCPLYSSSSLVDSMSSLHIRATNPKFILSGHGLSHKTEFQHLGVVLDSHIIGMQLLPRIRKFLGAVNGVVSRLGGYCQNDDVWMKIVEAKLFPVLSFGSHLWSIEKSGIARMVNTAYRKGVGRGLGLRQRNS